MTTYMEGDSALVLQKEMLDSSNELASLLKVKAPGAAAADALNDKSLNQQFAQEKTEREALDASVAAQALARAGEQSVERSSALSVDNSYATLISDEASNRGLAMSAETSSQTSAMVALSADMSTELVNQGLDISIEKAAREDADASITTRLDVEATALNTALVGEAGLRSDADKVISGEVSDEVVNRVDAYNLQIAARGSVDTVLLEQLSSAYSAANASESSELVARAAADTLLSDNVSSEAVSRAAAYTARSLAGGSADVSLDDDIASEMSDMTKAFAVTENNLALAGDSSVDTLRTDEISLEDSAMTSLATARSAAHSGATVDVGDQSIARDASADAQYAATSDGIKDRLTEYNSMVSARGTTINTWATDAGNANDAINSAMASDGVREAGERSVELSTAGSLDSSLATRISGLETGSDEKLSIEVAARGAADANITASISIEESSEDSADVRLAGELTAEAAKFVYQDHLAGSDFILGASVKMHFEEVGGIMQMEIFDI